MKRKRFADVVEKPDGAGEIPRGPTPEASRTVAGGPSVSERPPENETTNFPTADAVAEEFHAAWY